MEKAKLNYPLIILTGLTVGTASFYFLCRPRPALALLPPLLLPFLLWLGRRPIYGYYLIVALIPFNAWRALMGQYAFLTFSKLLGAFLIFILLIQLAENPMRVRRMFSKIWILLACFLTIAVVSTFYSTYPAECVDNLRMLITAYLFLGFSLFFIQAKQLKTVLPYIIAASTSVAALIAIGGYLFGIEALKLTSDPGIVSGRAMGSASNPNLMAATLLVGIPFVVFFFFESRSTGSRLLWSLLFLVISSAIAFSYSRSMLIVFAVLMVILFLDNIRRFRIRYTGFLAILTAAIVFYGIVKAPETAIWERLSTLSSPQTDTSLLRRSSYLIVAKDAIRENPFIGAGPGTFPLIYQQSSYASAFADDAFGLARSAHNTYLEVVVGTGGIGLVIFIGFLISAFTALYDAHKQAKPDDPTKAAFIRTIGWAFIAFLLAMMFISQLYHKYIWLLLGMALTAGRMTDNPPLEEKVFPTHE